MKANCDKIVIENPVGIIGGGEYIKQHFPDYTTDVIVEEQEFVESKSSSGENQQHRDNGSYQRNTAYQQQNTNNQGYYDAQFTDIPTSEDLPF